MDENDNRPARLAPLIEEMDSAIDLISETAVDALAVIEEEHSLLNEPRPVELPPIHEVAEPGVRVYVRRQRRVVGRKGASFSGIVDLADEVPYRIEVVLTLEEGS